MQRVKIGGFGFRRNREKSADSVVDSESVTTLNIHNIQILIPRPRVNIIEKLTPQQTDPSKKNCRKHTDTHMHTKPKAKPFARTAFKCAQKANAKASDSHSET